MKKFWFGSQESSNLRELIENSVLLKESITVFEGIGQCKDILKNIQKILMLNHRLRLNMINIQGESEKNSIPDDILFFSILVLCNCRNLLEQIYLMGDFLEIRENSQNEKNVFGSLKVKFLIIWVFFFKKINFFVGGIGF